MDSKNPPNYYPTKDEAKTAKKGDERIYYAAGKGWYLRRPEKRRFWDVY